MAGMAHFISYIARQAQPTDDGAGVPWPDQGGGDGGRVGTVGEPKLLRVLGAEDEPTAWIVRGAEFKPAKFGGGGGRLGIIGEPGLLLLGGLSVVADPNPPPPPGSEGCCCCCSADCW